MTAPPEPGNRVALFHCMVLMRRFEEEVLRIAQDHP